MKSARVLLSQRKMPMVSKNIGKLDPIVIPPPKQFSAAEVIRSPRYQQPFQLRDSSRKINRIGSQRNLSYQNNEKIDLHEIFNGQNEDDINLNLIYETQPMTERVTNGEAQKERLNKRRISLFIQKVRVGMPMNDRKMLQELGEAASWGVVNFDRILYIMAHFRHNLQVDVVYQQYQMSHAVKLVVKKFRENECKSVEVEQEKAEFLFSKQLLVIKVVRKLKQKIGYATLARLRSVASNKHPSIATIPMFYAFVRESSNQMKPQ